MKELINKSNQTPIEIALGIDENGRTTAKKLYAFLEMDRSHYSRWIKSNITENPYADENVDYWKLATDGERDLNPNPTQDYKLTAKFAKKLSMTQKNQKGEDARNYFTSVEDGAKEMVMRFQEMSPQLQFMINMEMEQKRQAKELSEVKENLKTTVQALSKESERDFRSWVNRALSSIAASKNYLFMGSPQERHQAVRTESYSRLTTKRPCRLEQRVAHERGRAVEAGATQEKVKAIN